MPTSIDFKAIIDKAEADVDTARTHLNEYVRLTAEWRYELKLAETMLQRLKALLADTDMTPIPETQLAAAKAFDEAPAPAPEPAKEVRTEPTPLPSAVGANGFDRANLKRQLRQWHIRYPLGVSHRVPSQMMRQALRAVLLDHEGFREDWLAKGGINFGDATGNYTLQDMRDAAVILGVDAEAVMNHAHKVQRLFLHYGVAGVDHHWDVNQ